RWLLRSTLLPYTTLFRSIGWRLRQVDRFIHMSRSRLFLNIDLRWRVDYPVYDAFLEMTIAIVKCGHAYLVVIVLKHLSDGFGNRYHRHAVDEFRNRAQRQLSG